MITTYHFNGATFSVISKSHLNTDYIKFISSPTEAGAENETKTSLSCLVVAVGDDR